jgi:hypothetical protein
MDRKALIILVILLTGAVFLTPGCADKKSSGGATPTMIPAATQAAGISPTAQASLAPATPGPSGASGNIPILDPSMVNLSGEGIDEGGFPETGLPTPTLD